MQKTFLSIGTGPGIGQSTAMRFAREGYKVILAARNHQRLRSLADQIVAEGGKAEVRQVDAADGIAVADLVLSFGSELHALHYNAAVLHYDENASLVPMTIDDESVTTLLSDTQVNISSALTAIKASLPALRAQGEGSILLTGGGFGIEPTPDFLNLSIGKAAIRATAKALFASLKDENIHVATVTVSRLVAPNSPQADEVAEHFWALHSQALENWTWESVYA